MGKFVLVCHNVYFNFRKNIIFRTLLRDNELKDK